MPMYTRFLLSTRTYVPGSLMRSQPMSTNTNEAVNRLRGVLEQYRQTHYRQEVPTRFKKELLKAARPPNTPKSDVCLKGMQRVLSNIGAKDSISSTELQMIFKENGNAAGNIPANKFLQIF